MKDYERIFFFLLGGNAVICSTDPKACRFRVKDTNQPHNEVYHCRYKKVPIPHPSKGQPYRICLTPRIDKSKNS